MSEIAPPVVVGAMPSRDALTFMRMDHYHERPRSTPGQMHDWHELVYVAHGQYTVETTAGMLTANEREFIYHPSHATHVPNTTVGPTPLLYLLAWQEPQTPAVYQRPRMGQDSSGRILMLLRWMWDLHPPGDDATREALQALLYLCLVELHNVARMDLPPAVEQAIRQMRHNLARPLTLDSLASVAGVSKYHLIRIFDRATGVTPMQYLQSLRVDVAVSLLLNTALPLAAIAEQVGVANPFHLSRLVHIRTGASPRALRKQHQEEK